jgi:hypothetical protein
MYNIKIKNMLKDIKKKRAKTIKKIIQDYILRIED